MKKIFYILPILVCQIFVFGQRKVGINTQPTDTDELRAELDVNGNVSLEKVKNDPSAQLLFLDAQTRRLMKFPAGAKPFNFIEQKITLPPNSDWVSDFDTKIPVNRYTLILAGSFFGNTAYDNNDDLTHNKISYGMAHTYRVKDDYLYNVEPKITLEPDEVSGTWHIKADYAGSRPYCKNFNGSNDECESGYYWLFNLLALDNSFATDLGWYEGSIKNYNNTDSAPTDILGALKTYFEKVGTPQPRSNRTN